MNQAKRLWLYFIVTMSVYLLMLLVTVPHLQAIAGLEILDMKPFYNSEYIISLFEHLGQDGRDYYLYRQLPIDMVYPPLFAFTYWKILGYFVQKLDWEKLKWVSFLPILAAIFDYAENSCIGSMLCSFPSLSETVIQVVPFFSLLKTIFTMLYLTAFLVLGVIFLVKRKRN